MSGHSKWSQIKYKKALEDVKKGKVFSRIGKMIAIAARENPSIESNAQLRSLIQSAKEVNMPKANIERAIQKGINKNESALEEILYEAFGPEGSSLLIYTITDNKNRSVNEVKRILDSKNGKFAQKGSVEWMFNKVVLAKIAKSGLNLEELELEAIEAGIEDTKINNENKELFVYASVNSWESAKKELQNKSIEILSEEISYMPKNIIGLSDEGKDQLKRLAGALLENDDVENVYASALYE